MHIKRSDTKSFSAHDVESCFAPKKYPKHSRGYTLSLQMPSPRSQRMDVLRLDGCVGKIRNWIPNGFQMTHSPKGCFTESCLAEKVAHNHPNPRGVTVHSEAGCID